MNISEILNLSDQALFIQIEEEFINPATARTNRANHMILINSRLSLDRIRLILDDPLSQTGQNEQINGIFLLTYFLFGKFKQFLIAKQENYEVTFTIGSLF